MNIQKLCPGCMKYMEEIEKMNVCPYCGFHIKNPQIKSYHLPPYTLVGEGNDKRYMIGRAVGEGAFGITYLSYDTKLEMKVAIKEFYPGKYATRENTVTKEVTLHNQEGINLEAMKNGAVHEARKLAKLDKYDGIVEVKDYFMDNETSYIVMEYIEGEDLKDYLKRNGGKLSVEQTKRMMKPVIEALEYVHKMNIIHRDISPDNLMITKDGNMKLIDFGAAREAEAGEKTVMVKLGYAPIEQFSATGNQGPWTDVYALAGTFYHCITGRKPVQATDRITNDAMIPPSQLGVAISLEEEAALLHALAVRTTDRTQNMQEFGRELYSSVTNTNINHIGNVQRTTPPYVNGNMGQRNMVQGQKPINVPMQQYAVQQKKSPVALIVAIVMGLVVLSIVGVVFLGVMTNKDTSSGDDIYADSKEEVQGKRTGNESNKSQINVYRSLDDWKADSYEGIEVTEILILLEQWDAFEEDEKAEAEEILAEMIATFQNEADRNMNTYIQINKDYASALQYILNVQSDLSRVEHYAVAVSYVNMEQYETKYASVLTEYETYVENKVADLAALGDEVSVEQVFTEADAYLSGDAYEKLKERSYTIVTIKKINRYMQNGAGAADIIAYINENLSKTGNNCWVVEYLDHFREVYRLETNAPITMVAQINHISNGYIIPSSNSINLNYTDLSYLSQYELYIAFFEIYARHGRMFSDPAVNQYFQACNWYMPTTTADAFDESCLNQYEKNNIATILAFQKENGYR